ncbi:MAG: hypothetical protein RBU27_05780 [Bacteroidota bacterium]|jgi:hypothetical protein|nr:hypothetical protein [Bacteroidota bacterium]
MIHFATAVFPRSVLFAALLLLTACGGRQLGIDEFHELANDAERHSTSIADVQQQMRALLQSYNQTVSSDRLLHLDFQPERGLAAAARSALATRIDDESDASCRGLLERIAELQETMDEHADRLDEITARLPAPHRVRSGENHYTLSMRYLTREHGLARGAADSLVARVALTGDIIEGFHIWFYYQDGVFGTFVTQGEAQISPTVFAKVVKRQLLEDARRQGHQEAFETILDSLQRSGALLANIRHGAPGL